MLPLYSTILYNLTEGVARPRKIGCTKRAPKIVHTNYSAKNWIENCYDI